MNRREMLQTLGLVGLYPYISFAESLPKVSAKNPKTLILIFQRGAVDALSMVSPLEDSAYTSAIRPKVFVDPKKMLKLNSSFGIHPSMSAMKAIWDQGQMSVFHQVGLPTHSRSHFDCQDFLESGTPDNKSTQDGLLARAFSGLPGHEKIKLSHLALQPSLPRSLYGASEALSFASLDKLEVKGLSGAGISKDGFESYFESALDEVLSNPLKATGGKEASHLIQQLQAAKKILLTNTFPKGPLASSLKDIAKILKSGMYVPFIVTEVGGWDTHVRQGNEDGQLANKLRDFSEAIGTFVKEIGPRIENVNILTVSEFGRTVHENGNGGTDHGHGSCYFLINGGLKPKNFANDWKDLKAENLFEGRDLPVTLDYRDIFASIFKSQFGINSTEKIFPNYKVEKNLRLFI